MAWPCQFYFFIIGTNTISIAVVYEIAPPNLFLVVVPYKEFYFFFLIQPLIEITVKLQ